MEPLLHDRRYGLGDYPSCCHWAAHRDTYAPQARPFTYLGFTHSLRSSPNACRQSNPIVSAFRVAVPFFPGRTRARITVGSLQRTCYPEMWVSIPPHLHMYRTTEVCTYGPPFVCTYKTTAVANRLIVAL